MHRIVLGPVPALERRLAAEVAAARADDPLAEVTVLCGGTLLRAHLRRRMAELDPRGGHLGVRVMTLGELALALGEHRLLAAGHRPLPVLADRLLAAEAAGAAGAPFGDVRDTPGFAAALHRTLLDLRRAGLAPDALAAAAPDAVEPDKTATIAAIAVRHAELRDGLYDPDDALRAADPARLPGDRLLVHGLWEMPATLRVAVAAVAATRPVVVFLAGGTGEDAHAELRAWLEADLGAVVEREADAAAVPTAIVSAPDPAREVREALRRCLAWARDGIPFHEMAIAYRHADVYRPLLAAGLREAGLPAYLHDGAPLSELPAGRRVLALLDLVARGDLRRSDVMAFAADARLPDAARFAGSPATWDRISREAGVVRGIDQWRTRLAAYAARVQARADPDDPLDRTAERIAEAEGLGAFVEDLHRHVARRPQNARWGEHVEHVRGLLDTFTTDHQPVVDALADLLRLDALAGETTAERFARVARGVVESLHATDGDAGALRARGITVLDVNTLRHLRFRAVALLGVAERAFPPPPRQDPLLLDAERARLGLPLRATGPDPEPLQFTVALQAASDAAVVSYARTEHGGRHRPQLPSVFLRGVAESLVGRPVAAEDLDALGPPYVTRLGAGRLGAERPDAALDRRERELSLLEQDTALGLALLARDRPPVARGRTAWLARTTGGALTAYEGQLSPEVAAALTADERFARPLSATGIETLATCALQSFFARALGLRATEDPEDLAQIAPHTRGSAVHLILERFLGEVGAADLPSPARRDAHLVRLRAIADEVLDAVEAQGLVGYPLTWAIDRRHIVEDLETWYDLEAADPAQWEDVRLEVGFGFEDDPPFVYRTASGREVALRGRIDRLDIAADRFRVTDFKTGVLRGAKTRMLEGGKLLQRPLYLLAAAWLVGEPPSAGSARYQSVSRGGRFEHHEVRGDRLVLDDLDRLLDGLAQAVQDGTFAARPSPRACAWCDFRRICAPVAQHEVRVAGKASDPRVAALRALEEIE